MIGRFFMLPFLAFYSTSPLIRRAFSITDGFEIPSGYDDIDSNTDLILQKIIQQKLYKEESLEYCVVTGASGGMGFEIAKAMHSDGNNIIMACRNMQRCELAKQKILNTSISNSTIEMMQLDISSLVSVKAFCDQLVSRKIKVTKLMNNAGAMSPKREINNEGFDNSITTNYLGHALLTLSLVRLMPPNSKIVSMLSLMHNFGILDNKFFTGGKYFNRFLAYSSAKLAMLTFSEKMSCILSERGINVYGADPGIVSTGIVKMNKIIDPLANLIARPLMRTPIVGATPAIKLLRNETFNGFKYIGLHDEKIIPRKEFDDPQAKNLFNVTIRICSLYL